MAQRPRRHRKHRKRTRSNQQRHERLSAAADPRASSAPHGAGELQTPDSYASRTTGEDAPYPQPYPVQAMTPDGYEDTRSSVAIVDGDPNSYPTPVQSPPQLYSEDETVEAESNAVSPQTLDADSWYGGDDMTITGWSTRGVRGSAPSSRQNSMDDYVTPSYPNQIQLGVGRRHDGSSHRLDGHGLGLQRQQPFYTSDSHHSFALTEFLREVSPLSPGMLRISLNPTPSPPDQPSTHG